MRNLKKVIALVAVFAMIVSTVAFAQSFSDVAETDNYYEAIEMLSKLSILTGDDEDGDGVMDFRPGDTITRAEVAVIISRIQGINNAAQTATEFTDVTADHWASGYVAQAAGQGIVNGYGDGKFGPEDPVLYEQAVKMLVETLGYAPFVNDNGGYPSGHLTAASRYGVLDGVVGGSTGAEATRGQVAQMVFNAVDTPLMDRSVYGANAEYSIMDGKNGNIFSTLLTRDLGVKKFSGVVTANQVTDLTTGNSSIDTDDAAEIVIDYDLNDDYYNYDVEADVDTLYEGESGAADYIGKHVNVYVKEGDRSGDYEIISISESNKNKTVSFTLDQFDKIDGSYVYYYKNENDRTSTSAKLQLNGDAVSGGILYNNVAVANDVTAAFGTKGSGALVTKDSQYSGKVTLIDNDTTSGYDVIKVEVGAPAVVDEVSASGRVTFKEVPYNSMGDKIVLEFDDEDNTQIIKLTKDGQPVEFSELTEWSVLSVLYNAAAEYYDVKVIDGTKVAGSIASRSDSDTSFDGYEYRIEGKDYEVAPNAYGRKANGWNPGTAGMFYIDDYGKIIAYDKNGATDIGTSTSDKYGFVLDATGVNDDWGKNNVRVQLLDKSGAVYDAYLASSTKFENADSDGVDLTSADLAGKNPADDPQVKIEDCDTEAIANAMRSQLITYAANSSGEIKTVTFFQTADDQDGTLYMDAMGTADYDEDQKELKVTGAAGGKGGRFDVGDETVVFFIKADAGSYATGIGENKKGSKSGSKVGTVASLADLTGKPVAVYDTDDVAGAVVLFNTSGGISPSSPIAVIDKIGKASSESGDEVTSVTFWMNGEKMDALTDEDLNDLKGLDSASQGDIYKFALNADGTVITDVEKYGSFTDRADGVLGVAGAAKMSWKVPDTDEVFYFGPAMEYSSANKRIRIAKGTEADITKDGEVVGKEIKAPYDFGNPYPVKTTTANVYVYDPVRNSNNIQAGDAADVEYSTDLVDREQAAKKGAITVKNSSNTVAEDEAALGMMDFVAAVEYDGDVLDVVIYKAYDFGRYSIADVTPAE